MDEHDSLDDSPRIAVPCPKAWDELEGSSALRYCDECRLHVIDTLAITRAETLRILAETSGSVCMRVAYDANGRSLHADEVAPERATPRPEVSRSRWLAWSSAALLAACGSDGDAASAVTKPSPPVEATSTEEAASSAPMRVGETDPRAGEVEPDDRFGDDVAEELDGALGEVAPDFVRQPIPVDAPSRTRGVIVTVGTVMGRPLVRIPRTDEGSQADWTEPR